MANTKNLKPLNTRSPRERKEIARKGAAASNKVQAEKKALREAAKLVLSLNVTDTKTKGILKSCGIPDSLQSYAMAMVIGQVKAAIGGNSTCFNAIRDVVGEKPELQEDIQRDNEIVFNIIPASQRPLEEVEEEF